MMNIILLGKDIESIFGQYDPIFMEKDDEVVQELLHLIQHISDAMDIMENLEEDNKPALVGTMENVMQSFKTLHEMEHQITGSVPIDLIEQIDKGNNPDDYSRKLVEEQEMSARRDQEKQKWMMAFKDSLDRSIVDQFGDLEKDL